MQHGNLFTSQNIIRIPTKQYNIYATVSLITDTHQIVHFVFELLKHQKCAFLTSTLY